MYIAFGSRKYFEAKIFTKLIPVALLGSILGVYVFINFSSKILSFFLGLVLFFLAIRIIFFDKYEFPKIIKNKTKIKNVYVASDEQKSKNRVIKNLKKNGFKVYYNNCTFNNNFRQTNGQDFLADLFALSKSKIIFTTVGGGIPLTAHLLSGERIKIIKFVNQINLFIFLRLFVLIIFYLKRLKSRF